LKRRARPKSYCVREKKDKGRWGGVEKRLFPLFSCPLHCLTLLFTPHCHPDELRGLSVEECAAIQTFPPGFCFAGSRNQRYRQTGNAVPVKFAQAIAAHLLNHMDWQHAVELRAA
jgi:site-specific DNA-cytosine methylase